MQPFHLQIYTRQDLIEKYLFLLGFQIMKVAKKPVTFKHISYLTGKVFFNEKCSGHLVFANETAWMTEIASVTSPG